MSQISQGEFRELIDAMRELVPLLTRVVEMPVGHVNPPAGQVQQVTLPPQLPPVSKGERAAWVSAFAALLAVVVAVMQGQRISDLGHYAAQATARQQAHEAWAREEAQIIRSYIWQGKVPPVNPYPPEPKK